MIKVLVIDDSAVMRAFLGRVVEAQPDMELAGGNAQSITGHASRQMIERVYQRMQTTQVAALRAPSSD